MVTRRGGFLAELDRFDPYFFGISPREVVFQDPQQRLMLEIAWEAIEDAGVLPQDLIGGHAGAIVGICHRDYSALRGSDAMNLGVYTGTGDGSAAAGWLCSGSWVPGPRTVHAKWRVSTRLASRARMSMW